MRGATDCARRLKKLLKTIKAETSKPPRPPTDDPITQLILGVFSRDLPESKARDALERLKQFVVDFNELRVTSPRELSEWVGEIPDAWTKCEDVSRALNRIFAGQHLVSLDHLRGKSRKDVRDYLTRLDGLEAYSRARIALLAFGHHAIPIDEAMWAYLRKLHIVDDQCSHEEAQAFLERQIDADDALLFVTAVRRDAWAEVGGEVRAGALPRIRSVPPQRASRNMLRPIATSQHEPVPADEGEPLDALAADELDENVSQSPAAPRTAHGTRSASSAPRRSTPRRKPKRTSRSRAKSA